jgi:hypothetical protein
VPDEVFGETAAASALAALPQLVEGVLADGLEIFVARLASREVRDDEGFVHEARQ